MKRDMDLVRSILIELEKRESDWASTNPTIDGRTEGDVSHHVFLMMQAGLVFGDDITHMESQNREALASGVTWQGHEFLDLVRSDTRWNKIKAKTIEQTGAAGFEAV